MKIQDKKNKKVLIGVIIFIVMIALGLTATVLYLNSNSNKNTEVTKDKTDNKEKSDKEKSDDGNSADDKSNGTKPDDSSNNGRTDNSNSTSNDNAGGKTPTQYEGANPNNNSSLTGIINYKSVVNNTLQIRTTINQYLDEGSCILTLNGPNGQTYTNSVNIIANPSSSTCYGFDIPLDLIQADQDKRRGEWTINIHMTSGTRAGDLQDKIAL